MKPPGIEFAGRLGRPWMSPLANTVLWALQAMVPITHKMHSEINSAVEDVIKPKEWWDVVSKRPLAGQQK